MSNLAGDDIVCSDKLFQQHIESVEKIDRAVVLAKHWIDLSEKSGWTVYAVLGQDLLDTLEHDG